MLGAFNEATPDWLSFFMFTFFTDRRSMDDMMKVRNLGKKSLEEVEQKLQALSLNLKLSEE